MHDYGWEMGGLWVKNGYEGGGLGEKWVDNEQRMGGRWVVM